MFLQLHGSESLSQPGSCLMQHCQKGMLPVKGMADIARGGWTDGTPYGKDLTSIAQPYSCKLGDTSKYGLQSENSDPMTVGKPESDPYSCIGNGFKLQSNGKYFFSQLYAFIFVQNIRNT